MHESDFDRLYESGMNRINAPDALRKSIMEPDTMKKTVRNTAIKRAMQSVAALVLCFGVCDGAIYAASGTSMTHQIFVLINGTETPVELEKIEQDGADPYYVGRIKKDGEEMTITTDDPQNFEDVRYSIEEDGKVESNNNTEENGQVQSQAVTSTEVETSGQ